MNGSGRASGGTATRFSGLLPPPVAIPMAGVKSYAVDRREGLSDGQLRYCLAKHKMCSMVERHSRAYLLKMCNIAVIKKTYIEIWMVVHLYLF